MATRPEIGRLRWPVTLAKRVQTAAGSDTIAESLTAIMVVHADIQPIAPMTFVASEQTDRPITHRIFIRWLDWIDMQNVIIRETLRLDLSGRREIYRIRRLSEWEGRKRFLEILAELEHRA